MQAVPKSSNWTRSRAEREPEAPLPPVPPPAGYLVDLFEQLGRSWSNGMGMTPLPFTEILAAAPWSEDWERNVIRDMSQSYLVGRRIGEDPFGIPPWEPTE